MIKINLKQYKWQPKSKHNKEDLELVKDLERIAQELDIGKTTLTRKALKLLVNYEENLHQIGSSSFGKFDFQKA